MNTRSVPSHQLPSVTAKSDARHSIFEALARGGSALGISTVLERGFGFLASMLAAKLAGPQVFGAYSLVLTTANTLSSYTGMGIGSTATRFSARYAPHSVGFRDLLRSLFYVSTLSAVLGCVAMFVGAGPLSHFVLHNPELSPLLRLAGLTVGVGIAVECCRGVLLGQQHFRSLLFLAATAGGALALALPLVARRGAFAMVGAHASALLLTLVVGAMFVASMASIQNVSPLVSNPIPKASVKSVLQFGAIQFSALMGISLTSWWIALLVARCDISLTQMGMYAVAGQIRNLASTIPGILGQVSLPMLTEEKCMEYGGAARVLGVNSFVASLLALSVGGVAIIGLPWVLPRLYGNSYSSAEPSCVLALAVAIIHMSTGPAANRLLITSLRLIGLVNLLWAVISIALSSWLVPLAGSAGALGSLLLAHFVSLALVLRALTRTGESPRGLTPLLVATSGGVLGLAALGVYRAISPHWHSAVAELAVLSICFVALMYLGHTRGWVPMRIYSIRPIAAGLSLFRST